MHTEGGRTFGVWCVVFWELSQFNIFKKAENENWYSCICILFSFFQWFCREIVLLQMNHPYGFYLTSLCAAYHRTYTMPLWNFWSLLGKFLSHIPCAWRNVELFWKLTLLPCVYARTCVCVCVTYLGCGCRRKTVDTEKVVFCSLQTPISKYSTGNIAP